MEGGICNRTAIFHLNGMRFPKELFSTLEADCVEISPQGIFDCHRLCCAIWQTNLTLLILNDNSLIARYDYVLETNYSFIHYTMLIVTNMLGDSARKTNERDKCSGSAGSTRQHLIVSREDLQMFAVVHFLKRHRPLIVCFYPVLDKFGDWNFGPRNGTLEPNSRKVGTGRRKHLKLSQRHLTFYTATKVSLSLYAWNVGVNSFALFTTSASKYFFLFPLSRIWRITQNMGKTG